MGVDITYTCINNCTIRVNHRVYRDCGGAQGVSIMTFNWNGGPGCTPPQQIGNWTPCNNNGSTNCWFVSEVTPVCPGTVTQCNNPGSNIRGVEEYYRYGDFDICNTNCSSYNIEWTGQNRNGGITSGAANQGIGTTQLSVNTSLQVCNNSPQFTNPPVPYVCESQPFTFNQGAVDPDGDSLSYSLGPCFTDANGTQVNYNPGFSPTAPMGASWTVNVNPISGDISFIPNPGNIEVGVMCVYVQEWRNGQVINNIVRDMQINVIPCPSNQVPVVNSVANIQNGVGSGGSATGIFVGTCVNSNLCLDIPVIDPNTQDTVTIWWNNGIPGGTFFETGNPTNTDTIIGQNPSVTFCWTPTTPGTFSFLVEMQDNACPNFGFSQFTVTIVVSAPLVAANPQPPRCDTISICALPFAGIPPFTYQWSGQGGLNSVDSCFTHIYPGPGTYGYTLTMTDSIGCSTTITDSVTVPPIPIADAGPDLLFCTSGTDTLGGVGGPNEVYLWTPGIFLNDSTSGNPILNINNPGPTVLNQQYILTVTNTQSNCVDMDTMNVTVSFPPQLSFVETPVLCYGNSTGAVDMTITNGLAPFTIAWTGPNGYNAATEDIANLFAGTYFVTVTDSAGCMSMDSVEVTQPPSPLWTNLIGTDVCCNGGADGAVELTVTGDSPPYIYSWSGPGGFNSANEDISGLIAGTYFITVTDTFGCAISDSIEITEPTAVNFAFTVYDAACNGDATGIVASTITGGHGNYSYSWSPINATSDSVTNLTAGTYVLEVTDTCFGADSVSLYYEDFEGNSPWTLNVATGPNGTERNFWTISDDEGGVLPPGCGTSNNNDRTLHITSLANPFGGAVYERGGLCGVGPCPETNMRAESPFINTTGYTGLTLTFDYISVGDALLDNASLLFNDGNGWQVLTPSIKSATCNPGQGQWTNFTAVLPASCNNIPDLQIGFNWTNNDDGNGNDPSIAVNNIRITGPQPVTVSTCTAIDSAVVGEPTPLNNAITSVDNLCFGDSAGSATAQASGGNGNYGYTWSNSGVGATINNLPAGIYTVTVTDTAFTPAGGTLGYLVCDRVDTIAILQPPALALVPSSASTSCFLGTDGSVSVAVSGGTPGYSYTWNTNPVQNTPTASNLPTGSYTVVVTDTNGCVDSATTAVSQPPPIISSTNSTNATCGDPTGTATVTSFGGVGGFTYQWNSNPVQTTQTAVNLLPGVYNVTITDLNGCEGFAQVTVGNEPRPTAAIDASTNALCFGSADGTASAVASGGTGPYTFFWSNGQTTPTATGLAAGLYSVVVTDNFGCTDTAFVTINQPPPITASVVVTNMGCMSTTPDGSIGVVPSGGTPGYTYQWNTMPVQTTQLATNLMPGIYTVTITDLNGCTLEVTDTIIQIPRPDVTAGPDVSFCEGEGGAQLTSFATGGQTPYYYSWYCDSSYTFCGLDSVNDDDPIANPDSSTWYYVFVTDVNGCVSDTDSVFVTELPKPIVDAGADVFMCGDSAPCVVLNPVVVNNSQLSGFYGYNWSPGVGLNDSTAATPCARPDTTTIYSLVVTDSTTGCSSELTLTDTLATVTVHVNPVPVAVAGPDFDICLGDSVVLQGFGTDAGPVYEYQWSPSNGLSDTTIANPIANPTVTTVYSLVVYSNDCPSYADSVEVRVHTIPTVEAGWDREICLGETAILDAQAGGDSTATYTFEWQDTVGIIGSNLLEDIFVSPDSTTAYTVVATTNWGCSSAPDTAVVYVKPAPIAEAGDNIAICGSDSVQLQGSYYYTTTDSAPISQITYNWTPTTNMDDPTSPTPTVWPENSTWYYLTVNYTDCSFTDSVLVTVIPEMIATIDADTSVICSVDSVQLFSSGGLGGASYTWFPPNGLSDPTTANPMASPDTTTTYTVVIAEGGCSDSAAVTINVIPSPEPAYVSSLEEGCVPHTVNFIQTATDAIAYIWDFGDGTPVSNEEFPTHIYEGPGRFDVTLTVVNTGGCAASISSVTVNVLDTAKVDFTSNPAPPIEMHLPATDVQFTNLTQEATVFNWNFGDGRVSTEYEPAHTYTDPGEYFVTLIATNIYGCHGMAIQGPYIVITPDLFIPNVFSPNDDDINDRFLVEYTGSQPFTIQVYDRWGVMVYESRNKQQGWNGKDQQGNDVPDGVYYYYVKIADKEYAGDVTLVR